MAAPAMMATLLSPKNLHTKLYIDYIGILCDQACKNHNYQQCKYKIAPVFILILSIYVSFKRYENL